jgi:hypothetical protein
MNMPGFTAEASKYEATNTYRMGCTSAGSDSRTVTPAAIVAGHFIFCHLVCPGGFVRGCWISCSPVLCWASSSGRGGCIGVD